MVTGLRAQGQANILAECEHAGTSEHEGDWRMMWSIRTDPHLQVRVLRRAEDAVMLAERFTYPPMTGATSCCALA